MWKSSALWSTHIFFSLIIYLSPFSSYTGTPVRRYPRKFTAYDMENDILALLNGEPLPAESPAFAKAWREAKREAVKSEYSFRYNYNYYTAPDSMYKYNPDKDK